jgi:hypothetical protein
MLTVHWQHFLDKKEDIIKSNQRIAYHFGKFVELTPAQDRKNGQVTACDGVFLTKATLARELKNLMHMYVCVL